MDIFRYSYVHLVHTVPVVPEFLLVQHDLAHDFVIFPVVLNSLIQLGHRIFLFLEHHFLYGVQRIHHIGHSQNINRSKCIMRPAY